MSHLGALRTFLEAHFPRTTAEEQECTCGAGNHVRLRYFRVNGQPITAVIPEGANLTAQDLRVAMGCAWAESLPDEEAGRVLEDTELGHMDWFENPFGSSVFLDDLLLPYAEIVFCPRMFFGQRGECFRVPTQEFLQLTQAVVLPLTAPACRQVNDWAV